MGRRFKEEDRKREVPWLIGNKINKGRIPWNKGKTGIYSDEKKKEMVANKKSTKGIKMSPSFSEKMSKIHKGKFVSEETRNKMSLSRKGKKLSDEHKEKLNEVLKKYRGEKGSQSNFWKGGITDISLMIKASEKYKNWRKKIYERDNYTCQECGKQSKLEVHHIKSYSSILSELKKMSDNDLYNNAISCELLWDISNGITLCRDCHTKTDNYLIKAKLQLIEN